MKPKSPPYSKRVTRWFCDCGKEHRTEALAWACECYQALVVCDHADVCYAEWCRSRLPHLKTSCASNCEKGGFCWVKTTYVCCVPVEAKEAGDV